MDLSIAENLAIGNGILTVESEDQAWDRADQDRKDKGGGAAEAALAMVALRAKLGTDGCGQFHHEADAGPAPVGSSSGSSADVLSGADVRPVSG